MPSINLAAESGPSASGNPIQLVILLLIPLAMYLLLIRPQRRKMKEQQMLQAELGKGDEVITTSGIYGFISAVEDTYFWLEIDDDVQIRIAKAAIQGKAPVPTSSESEPKPSKSDSSKSESSKATSAKSAGAAAKSTVAAKTKTSRGAVKSAATDDEGAS